MTIDVFYTPNAECHQLSRIKTNFDVAHAIAFSKVVAKANGGEGLVRINVMPNFKFYQILLVPYREYSIMQNESFWHWR